MKRLIAAAAVLCCIIHHLSAQHFNMEAGIEKTDQKGFYNILLTPEITTHLNDHFSDIRLYDEEGKEIPYLLRSESPSQPQQLFKDYEIVEKRFQKNCCTHLVLRNPGKGRINNISLIIRNADARKQAKLSGSDDQENWYVIREQIDLEAIIGSNETYEVKILDFPLSDYEYYRLDIADSGNAPLNILRAGYYDTYLENGKYLDLPAATIQQKDSTDKRSYVHIAFPSLQYIDQLRIEAAGPQYYLRNASLNLPYRHKGKTTYSIILDTEIRSNHDNTLQLDHYKAKELVLIIDNKDNEPLKVRNIRGRQLIHYLTAGLEKGKKYHLRFGNPAVSYPEYDLEYFKDSIPAQVKQLIPGNIVSKTADKKDSKSYFTSTLWIWVAIVLVIVLLGFMSMKMIREIGDGEEKKG